MRLKWSNNLINEIFARQYVNNYIFTLKIFTLIFSNYYAVKPGSGGILVAPNIRELSKPHRGDILSQ
jgi:hypothetical protein